MGKSFFDKIKNTYILFIRGNFTVRYIFGLSLIAILALAQQIIIQYNLDEQKEGFQRVQELRDHLGGVRKLKSDLFLLQLEKSDQTVQLRVQDYQVNFKHFKKAGSNLWHNSHNQELKSVLEQLDDDFQKFMISSVKDRKNLASRAFAIGQSLNHYYDSANDELVHFHRRLDRKLENFRRFEFLIFLLIILTLFLEAIFIFHPAITNLNRALRARSEFFSKIGHEIRNPINAILGISTILEESKLDKNQAMYLSRLKRSTQGLLSFLNNIIEYTGVENKKISVKMSTFLLKDLIDETLTVFSVESFKKNNEMLVYINPDVPQEITSDFVKLKHILLNLVGNAVKFTEEGKITLEISLIRKNVGGYLVVSVTDTGPGIPEEKQKDIFLGFVQADDDVQKKFGGTGLGLAIVREYLDLLEGNIQLVSSLGHGSSFTIKVPVGFASAYNELGFPKEVEKIISIGGETLEKWVTFHLKQSPLKHEHYACLDDLPKEQLKKVIIIDQVSSPVLYREQAQHFTYANVYLNRMNFGEVNEKFLHPLYPLVPWMVEENIYKPKPMNKTVEKLKALICDDSKDNGEIMSFYLKKLITQVEVVESGHECLKSLQEKSFDLALIDIQMPEMDGYVLLDKIRSLGLSRKTKFIAFTAFTGSRELEKIKKHGFDYILTKPVHQDAITFALQDLGLIGEQNLVRPKATLDAEERVRQKLLSKRPEFISKKLQDISGIEKLSEVQQILKEYQRLGHQLKGTSTHFDYPELMDMGAKLESVAQSLNYENSHKIFLDIKDFCLKQKF